MSYRYNLFVLSDTTILACFSSPAIVILLLGAFASSFASFISSNLLSLVPSTACVSFAAADFSIPNEKVESTSEPEPKILPLFGFSKSSFSGYIYITVDINGPAKGLNRFGYDVFSFYIIDNNLNFCGDKIPGIGVSCDESNEARNGLGCTQKAVYDKNYFKNLK